MAKYAYKGPARRCWVDGILFPRGTPVEVSAAVARQLGDQFTKSTAEKPQKETSKS